MTSSSSHEVAISYRTIRCDAAQAMYVGLFNMLLRDVMTSSMALARVNGRIVSRRFTRLRRLAISYRQSLHELRDVAISHEVVSAMYAMFGP